MKEKLEIYEEKRPWGNFRQYTHNEISTIKIISINPNQSLSLQSHNYRSEFWKVLNGGGYFVIGDHKYEVSVGDEEFVKEGEKHRIVAGEFGISILEISFGNFDENDIVRYQDKYGRI